MWAATPLLVVACNAGDCMRGDYIFSSCYTVFVGALEEASRFALEFSRLAGWLAADTSSRNQVRARQLV